MTSSFELLNSDQHGNLRIKIDQLDTPENRSNTALVTIGELSTLVHEYPIFISKSPSSGEFQLMAILGFSADENLYLQSNRWEAIYLPLDISRRPFQAYVPDANKLDQGRIAIDTSSVQISENEGEALFDEQGEATDYLKKMQTIFAKLMGGMTQTREILKQADKLKLIEAISLNIEIPARGKASLNGLYSFDKKALTSLRGDALQQAHDAGILQVSHLLLSSTLHLQKLINWASKSSDKG